MAKQTFTTGQVLLASQLTSLQQTAMLGGAASAKTASYTLVAADAGTAISMTSTSATTVTVNTGLFAAGDTVFIQNLGSGNLTITAGSATVATAGSLILPQNDAGILYFVSTSSSVFYDFIQVGAASPLTTKGDLYTFSTSDARLPVGTNGQVLTANSAAATGLEYTTISAGGITLITETTASALSSVTYGSIPSTYKELLLVWDGLVCSDSSTGFQIRINNDSGSNYYGKVFLGTTTVVIREGSGASTVIGEGSQSMVIGSSGTNLARLGAGSFRIYNYASATKKKRYDYQSGFYYNAIGEMRGGITIGSYDSTTAVTSIDIFRSAGTGTFSNATDTSIRLYGIS